jgi:16S rRNA (uracil1498-N3)-methyltransferase
MELIVQKAVEIGAAEITPIISDRTIVQVDSESAAQKQVKWQQITIEAAKQCGQNWLPQVHAPQKLNDFFGVEARVPTRTANDLRGTAATPDLRLIGCFSRCAAQKSSPGLLERTRTAPGVLMLIGPEAISRLQSALARRHGCRPITLGPIILR